MCGKNILQNLNSSYFSKFIWNAVTQGENSDCVLSESLKNSLFTIYCFSYWAVLGTGYAAMTFKSVVMWNILT